MRTWWQGVCWLTAGLLAVAGCVSTPRPKIQKPAHVETFTLPPSDDSRFSAPPSYPKDVLNQDLSKKSTTPQGLPPAGALRSRSHG